MAAALERARFDLAAGCAALARAEPEFARLLPKLGPLEPRRCPDGFGGLVWMVLGQQVSTASARAAWARLEAAAGEVSAASLSELSDEVIRACGVSRPKLAYVRALAQSSIDFAALSAAEDEAVVAQLMALKGVGRWTAETWLMMALGRGDLFPAADVALQEAVRWLERLPVRPSAEETARIAKRWRPHRSAAAHMLWAWYGAVRSGALAHPLKLEEAA